MVFTSPVERAVPDRVADERDALTQQLDFHRATLLRKLEGLDGERLRRPMTASGLSLLGLVKHLAETEHGWFLRIYAGLPEPDLFPADGDPDADFRVGPGETTETVVGQYLRTCERARAVVAAGALDDVVTTPSGAEANLRSILVHMIQETARHNGHADIIREAIDGTTGH
ncbi:DinB family protein [Kribbella shirazensis]|uniref:Putative damage-inducible protein DinB n=1 Tax=Kribbella shirazensis TaxID=1105143 RepID=A0A7X6A046_9ACTN|nr:DinB family protein [Kribbella shirazensis]NIK56747.1 putative damage-inducible protein DinB [Kribbella shirazensis]